MDTQVIAFLGTHLLAGGTLSLPDANTIIAEEFKNHATGITHFQLAEEAEDKAYLLDLRGALTRDELEGIIRDTICKHFLAEGCNYTPLTQGIHNTNYGLDGQVSVSNSLRVFPVTHEDYQNDGWSCLYRSMLSASALQRYIGAGHDVISSEKIGLYCRELRANVGFSGCIDYIKLRDTLSEVYALLPQEQGWIERSIQLLDEPNPSVLRIVHSLQPDYFIQRQALAFLKNLSGFFHAIALLGKASDT